MSTDRASKSLVLALALLAVVAYLNALRLGFTFDDRPQILNNLAATSGLDLVGILSTPLSPGNLFRPLTVFTFAVNNVLSPGDPTVSHAVNVMLHVIVTILVYVLAVRLFASSRVGVIAGALFAVHPVHTEAVTSLVGRAEILAALFGLIALLVLDPTNPRESRTRRLVSVAAFSLALLSKESALTVLPLLMLYRVARRGEPVWQGLWGEFRSLDWVPYLLCAAVFLALRFYVVAAAVIPPYPLTPLNNVLGFVPVSVRIRSALGVLWDYVGLLNVPLVLSADYSYNQVPVSVSWLDARYLAGALVMAGTAALALWHRRPQIRFAAALPLVTLALTSNLLFPIGTIKAERLLYLPSVGWALLVAYAFDRLLEVPRYRRVATGVLCAIVAAFAARTWTRNWDWKDDVTLYRSMIDTAPGSAKGYYNYGIALQRQHADDLAVPAFRKAMAIYPLWDEIYYNIGLAYQRRGFPWRALEWYKRALELAPGFTDVHSNMCYVLYKHEHYEEAVAACRRGLKYNPTDANLLKGLGTSLIATGDRDKGIGVLRRSLALNVADRPLREYLAALDVATSDSAPRRILR